MHLFGILQLSVQKVGPHYKHNPSMAIDITLSCDIHTCTVGPGEGAFFGVLAFSFRANCDLNGDP